MTRLYPRKLVHGIQRIFRRRRRSTASSCTSAQDDGSRSKMVVPDSSHHTTCMGYQASPSSCESAEHVPIPVRDNKMQQIEDLNNRCPNPENFFRVPEPACREKHSKKVYDKLTTQLQFQNDLDVSRLHGFDNVTKSEATEMGKDDSSQSACSLGSSRKDLPSANTVEPLKVNKTAAKSVYNDVRSLAVAHNADANNVESSEVDQLVTDRDHADGRSLAVACNADANNVESDSNKSLKYNETAANRDDDDDVHFPVSKARDIHSRMRRVKRTKSRKKRMHNTANEKCVSASKQTTTPPKKKRKRKKKARQLQRHKDHPKTFSPSPHTRRVANNEGTVQSSNGSGGKKRQSKKDHAGKSKKTKTTQQTKPTAFFRGAVMCHGGSSGGDRNDDNDDNGKKKSPNEDCGDEEEPTSDQDEETDVSSETETVKSKPQDDQEGKGKTPRVVTGDLTENIVQGSEIEANAEAIVSEEKTIARQYYSGEYSDERDRSTALDEDALLQIQGILPPPDSKLGPPHSFPNTRETLAQPSTEYSAFLSCFVFDRTRIPIGLKIMPWGMVEVQVPQQPENLNILPSPNNVHHENPAPLPNPIKVFSQTCPPEPTPLQCDVLWGCCVPIAVNCTLNERVLPSLRDVMLQLVRTGQARHILITFRALLEVYCKCERVTSVISPNCFGLDANAMLSCVQVDTSCQEASVRCEGRQIVVNACHLVQGQKPVDFVSSLKTTIEYFIEIWKTFHNNCCAPPASSDVACIAILESFVRAAETAIIQDGSAIDLDILLAMLDY